jgi:formylglycine-generating enzyme required for sulfatase activity
MRGAAACRLVTGLIATLLSAASGAVQLPEPGAVRTERIPGTDIEFQLAFVPGGEFELGTPAGTPGTDDDERPARRVLLSPYWIGVHEVSYEEFEIFRYRGLDDHVAASPEMTFDADAVSRPTPPYEDPGHGGGQGRHPATGMTRRAALYYGRWLSEKTGTLYRLPTEAEWEMACRAGANSAGGPPAGEGAWTALNSDGAHHPGGERAANAWGLHDMLGNVSEWVLDTYSGTAYAELPADEPARDPVAGSPPRGRGIVRGGGYDDPLLRCSDRLPELARWKRRDPQIPKSQWWNTDSPHVGFRLVSPARNHSAEEIRAYWDELLGS